MVLVSSGAVSVMPSGVSIVVFILSSVLIGRESFQSYAVLGRSGWSHLFRGFWLGWLLGRHLFVVKLKGILE